MGLFRRVKLTRKDFISSIGGAILFPFLIMLPFSYDNFKFGYTLNFLLFFLLSLGNGFIAASINISWIEFPVKSFIYNFFISLIYTVSVAIISVILVSFIFHGHSPAETLRYVDFDYVFWVILITILIQLFVFGSTFLNNWRKSELQAAELREAQIAAQYETLQNQVNPHFLFNSLNVLSTLVYKDPDIAATFIKQLSKVYRYVLDAKNKEVVSLKTELEALEAYVFLLELRFNKGLNISNDLGAMDDWYIAPLSLQMLVENAVKHNTVHIDQALHIKLYAEGDRIFVKNNLQKKNNVQESMGIGLTNIKKRYQYLSEQPVEIEETTDHFQVSLPAILVE